jgi:hypothetical protein
MKTLRSSDSPLEQTGTPLSSLHLRGESVGFVDVWLGHCCYRAGSI